MKIGLKNFFKNKKVLVTGHTGFKGAWISRILLNWGAKVVGISLSPHTAPNLFQALELEKRIKNYFVDIREYEKIRSIMEKEKPDIIMHLAALAIVRESYDDPLNTFSTNVMGTVHVLNAAREVGSVRSVVIVTTDKVYQNKERLRPYREDDQLGGRDPYSASKVSADFAAQSYINSYFNPRDLGALHQKAIAIARAGNIIGGGDWGRDRLIPDIARAVFEGNGKVVIRNPASIRPWQHVLEPISGYLILARELYLGNKKAIGAWNFAHDKSSFITVGEITKRILAICGKGTYEVVPDSKKHEAGILTLDASKAKTMLGWRPKLSIDEALDKTMAWYGCYYEKKRFINEFTNQQIESYFRKV